MIAVKKPDFTFVLLSYNQGRFVREALVGAFSQTFANLEILILDDGSTDGSQEIIREAIQNYKGPHSIVTEFNARNVGLIPQVNKGFHLATAPFLVMAAGDDVSIPTRVERIATAIGSADNVGRGSAMAIVSDAIAIDEAGRSRGYIDNSAKFPSGFTADSLAVSGGYINGAAAGYSRRLLEVFGDIDSALWAEDSILPFRAALLGQIVHIGEPLLQRRIHPASMTGGANSDLESLLKTMRPAVFAMSARLADLENIDVCSRIDSARREILRRAVENSIERQRRLIAIAERRRNAIVHLMQAVWRGLISPSSAFRFLLAVRFRKAWQLYTRTRAKVSR